MEPISTLSSSTMITSTLIRRSSSLEEELLLQTLPPPRINPRLACTSSILATHAIAVILPCASRPRHDSAGPIPAYVIPVDSILGLTNPYPIPDPSCMTTDRIPAVATRNSNQNLLEDSRKFSTSLALRKYCLVLQSSGYAIFFYHVLPVSISFFVILLDM